MPWACFLALRGGLGDSRPPACAPVAHDGRRREPARCRTKTTGGRRLTTRRRAIELVVRCRPGLAIDLALPCGRQFPKWRATGRRYGGWRDRLTEVDEDVAHGRAVGDEGDDPHLGAAERAAEWEDLIDAGQQQCPGVAGSAPMSRFGGGFRVGCRRRGRRKTIRVRAITPTSCHAFHCHTRPQSCDRVFAEDNRSQTFPVPRDKAPARTQELSATAKRMVANALRLHCRQRPVAV